MPPAHLEEEESRAQNDDESNRKEVRTKNQAATSEGSTSELLPNTADPKQGFQHERPIGIAQTSAPAPASHSRVSDTLSIYRNQDRNEISRNHASVCMDVTPQTLTDPIAAEEVPAQTDPTPPSSSDVQQSHLRAAFSMAHQYIALRLAEEVAVRNMLESVDIAQEIEFDDFQPEARQSTGPFCMGAAESDLSPDNVMDSLELAELQQRERLLRIVEEGPFAANPKVVRSLRNFRQEITGRIGQLLLRGGRIEEAAEWIAFGFELVHPLVTPPRSLIRLRRDVLSAGQVSPETPLGIPSRLFRTPFEQLKPGTCPSQPLGAFNTPRPIRRHDAGVNEPFEDASQGSDDFFGLGTPTRGEELYLQLPVTDGTGLNPSLPSLAPGSLGSLVCYGEAETASKESRMLWLRVG